MLQGVTVSTNSTQMPVILLLMEGRVKAGSFG